jgi:hypothetical protein
VLRETGWSWEAYMNTPLRVVERLLWRLDVEAKKRQFEDCKSRKRR